MEAPDEVVYQAWPLDTIKEAWEQFSKIMYDGAGPEELSAGLHGMDFLMRRSDIPEPMLTIINATLDNARIRISLMLEKEAEERTAAEQWAHIERGMNILRVNLRSITRLIDSYRSQDPDYVREQVQKRIEYEKERGGYSG